MRMKVLFLVLSALLAVPGILSARQLTADEALRALGREKGEPWLGRLVEARGANGDPQPVQWVLSFKDAAARGGVREFVVGANGVTGERTPVEAGALGKSTAFASRVIKVDSTGAFAAANREAARAKLAFDSLNYRLRDRNGTPVWRVELFDAGGLEVGRLEVSGRDGTVVTPLRQPVRPGTGTQAAAAPTEGAAGEGPLADRWVEGGGLFGHLGRWGERTWDATKDTSQRAGDSVSKFFTGRPLREAPAGN
jgi:hypothetical protein